MSDSLVNTLARAIRAERGRHGWSQSHLGELLGWSQSKVAEVEAGTRRVWAHDLPEVCAVLEVSLDRLLIDGTPEDRRKLGFKV